jgi:hypothetical protein
VCVVPSHWQTLASTLSSTFNGTKVQILSNDAGFRWRKRVGVEPTGDRIACRPPVLKTGTITGPHALPWNGGEKAMDDEVADRSPLQRSADRAIHGCSFRRLETTGLKPRGIWPLKEAYRAALPQPIIWSVVPERCSRALFRSILPPALFQGAHSQLSSAAPFQGTAAKRCSTLRTYFGCGTMRR